MSTTVLKLFAIYSELKTWLFIDRNKFQAKRKDAKRLGSNWKSFLSCLGSGSCMLPVNISFTTQVSVRQTFSRNVSFTSEIVMFLLRKRKKKVSRVVFESCFKYRIHCLWIYLLKKRKKSVKLFSRLFSSQWIHVMNILAGNWEWKLFH